MHPRKENELICIMSLPRRGLELLVGISFSTFYLMVVPLQRNKSNIAFAFAFQCLVVLLCFCFRFRFRYCHPLTVGK